MSKPSEAKTAQGYVDKPVPHTCGACKNFAFDIQLPAWMAQRNAETPDRPRWHIRDYGQENNKRCVLGGFAVKKTATCTLWLAKG